MDRFYCEGSVRDISSLRAIQIFTNSKQVSKNVNNHYHAVNLFLEKVLNGHLIAYADSFKHNSGLNIDTGIQINVNSELILFISDSFMNLVEV